MVSERSGAEQSENNGFSLLFGKKLPIKRDMQRMKMCGMWLRTVFTEGTRVKAFGLQSSSGAGYNGRVGTIVGGPTSGDTVAMDACARALG